MPRGLIFRGGRSVRHHQTRIHWRNHIEAWKRSNQSAAAYCRTHQLRYEAFQRWHTRFKLQNEPESAQGFVRVIEDNQSIAIQHYHPAMTSTSPSSIEIEISGSVRIKLPALAISDLVTLIRSLREHHP